MCHCFIIVMYKIKNGHSSESLRYRHLVLGMVPKTVDPTLPMMQPNTIFGIHSDLFSTLTQFPFNMLLS